MAGLSIGRIVLAAFAAHAVGGDELGRHEPHGLAELAKLARPVVCARAGFDADQAGRQIGDEFEQLGAWHLGAHQCRFAGLIHAVQGKNVLCQIDANGYDSHDFPSQVS